MSTAKTNQYLSRRPMVLGLAKVLFLSLGRLPYVEALPFHAGSIWLTEHKGKDEPSGDASTWLYLVMAAILVLLGGAFAGLTIALMGQDEIYLQVIEDSGEGREKANARGVLKLLHRGKHWVLVTLLLSNVITNETLPIVLDRGLGGGWPAVLGSTVLVVIFGEVVPQSICVRFGLPIGAWMSPFVLVLMYIMAPVAWPTAKLLDYLLGEDHGTVYKKAGLKTLVSLHRNMGESGQRLHADEVTIISAVLDLKEKNVGSIMTPMDDVFTLSLDDVLDETTMDDILSQGYSRIPVHHPDNDDDFVGMLLVKMLITYDPEDAKPVRDFALATLPETMPDTSCLDIVNFFQEGKSHMVLVSNHPGDDHGAIGVVTLEDVIEELIGEEIIDESDVFVDIHKAIRRITPAPRMRIPRGHIAAEVVAPKGPAADLIDINEGEPLEVGELQKAKTSDDMGSKPKNGPQRRSSANSVIVEPKVPLKQRQNMDEMKEHLKHLGPSNLASRPKTTRYSSVKIKPGMDQSPNPLLVTTASRAPAIRRISETNSEFNSGIGEEVLKDGGLAARDGVQALRQDYGATSSSPTQQRSPNANKGVQAELDAQPEVEEEDGNHQLEPPKQNGKSEDILSDLPPSRSRSPYYQSRGPARSGSITENIIDANGVRKVVLETTSSSDSNEDEGNSGANRRRGDSVRPSSVRTNTATTSRSDQQSDGQGQAAEVSGTKKRRRRKKKNNAGKGEREPLLGAQK